MNFVINIPGDRRVGVVDHLGLRTGDPIPPYDEGGDIYATPLHYIEHRHDQETGKRFVAIVYEVAE